MMMADDGMWRSFIEKYKNLPELWDTKSENYKNKNVRLKAYNKLLEEYKKIVDNATVECLKKKIANMRTCYRRELKKINESESSGAGCSNIYVTSLWYFDLLDFLKDIETPTYGRWTKMRSKHKIQNTAIDKQHKIKRIKTCNKAADAGTGLLREAKEHLEESKKDDAAIYADGWACMLRKMTSEQQLYAKQAVDEIMLMGRLNKLNLNFLQSSSTPYTQSCSPYNNSDAQNEVLYEITKSEPSEPNAQPADCND